MWSDVRLPDGRTPIRSFLQKKNKQYAALLEKCQSSCQNATPEQLIWSSWPGINVFPNNQIKVWCKCQTHFLINSITHIPSAQQLRACNSSLILQNKQGCKRYLTFTSSMTLRSNPPWDPLSWLLQCFFSEATQLVALFMCSFVSLWYLSATTLRCSLNNSRFLV